MPDRRFPDKPTRPSERAQEKKMKYRADPYGEAMSDIKIALALAYIFKGGMSEYEYTILKNVEEYIRRLDNA